MIAKDYGEERLVLIGMAEGNVVLFVADTEREGRMRIIQRGEQHKMRKTTTSSRAANLPRPMTGEAIEQAARSDRDAQPLTEMDLKRMQRTPRQCSGFCVSRRSQLLVVPAGRWRACPSNESWA